MSGIFSTLNVANKGMIASQTALHTTGHNISNANTEGYSRQRVELKADLAQTLGGVGQLGTGVRMEGVARVVDNYITEQIRKESGIFSKFQVKSEVLEQMEIIFNEPSDTSLNFNLGEMFDAWTELSKNPELLTSKSIVVEKSKTTAETINHLVSQLESLKDEITHQIESNVTDFNKKIKDLESLNAQIFNLTVKGLKPNDLLDQRDLLLKELGEITEIQIDLTDRFDRAAIKVDGQDILTVQGFSAELNSDDISPKSGKISGYQEVLAEVNDQITKLNSFAVTMAEAINNIHRTGASGEDFFTFKDVDDDGVPDMTAAGIEVNERLTGDNSLVNAGTGLNPPIGDGSLALEISNKIRNKPFNFGTVDNPEDNTIEGAYKKMVITVGVSKQQSDNMVANQEVLLDQLAMRRESASGVSIDEEVTNLIKFQKSYAANARVIQTLTEMLDILINRTGV
jgi:flagellar hook-associated protein 1 FlgK